MRFMQTESVLQTKNWSGPAKNRFSVALGCRVLKIKIDPDLSELLKKNGEFNFLNNRHFIL